MHLTLVVLFRMATADRSADITDLRFVHRDFFEVWRQGRGERKVNQV